MADVPSPVSATPKISVQTGSEYKDREAWFTVTPDPWVQISTMEYGLDRTFATTIHRMIVNAETEQHPVMEEKLIAVIARPEITPAGLQFGCRMLGLIGSVRCVPEVSKRLAQNETADFARSALDRIQDPMVDEAYRASLSKLSGAAKIGLIGSMAGREDRLAPDLLTRVALDAAETVEVRMAAERAVEKLSAKVL